MFELAGLLYGPAKDLLTHLGKTEDKTKEVDFGWPVYSGAQDTAAQLGWELCWVRSSNEQRRISEGYQVWYEIEKNAKIRHRLQTSDGSVLMGRPIDTEGQP